MTVAGLRFVINMEYLTDSCDDRDRQSMPHLGGSHPKMSRHWSLTRIE
jgi:hypothetical protein